MKDLVQWVSCHGCNQSVKAWHTSRWVRDCEVNFQSLGKNTYIQWKLNNYGPNMVYINELQPKKNELKGNKKQLKLFILRLW